jgi:hypothetical protein
VGGRASIRPPPGRTIDEVRPDPRRRPAVHGRRQTPSEPSEWRRSDLGPQAPAATAFTGETDGIRHATVVIRTKGDRTLPDGSGRHYRGVVIRTEIRCGDRMWRILSMTYHGADYAAFERMGEIAEAPLVRETPLHSAITDVCDGGHAGPIGLTTEDPVAVQRWLDGV